MGIIDLSKDVWADGDSYDPYIGRWSRLVGQEFVSWLAVPPRSQWLDIGAGTGALSLTILNHANPKKVKGIDRSEGYVEFLQKRIDHPDAEFQVGNAQSLAFDSNTFDVAVSGLVLNFVPRPHQMISEMSRVVGDGGTVAVYVWDYAGRMQMLRHFWNAAVALDPAARDLDEGRRFPVCHPDALMDLFQNAGLAQVQSRPIDVAADFQNFDDYWSPFLGGQGPAPGYVMSLTESRRSQLRERIYNSLPFALDGTIPLVLRAWAVKGIKSNRI